MDQLALTEKVALLMETDDSVHVHDEIEEVHWRHHSEETVVPLADEFPIGVLLEEVWMEELARNLLV